MRKLDWLENGNIEKLAAALRKLSDAEQNAELAKIIRIEAEYFDSNCERMRYPEFRKMNLFVGSGVIEAGCKTVIGSRLKQSGMRYARNRVLDRARRQRDHCTALLPAQWRA